jgi:hypothetical protein
MVGEARAADCLHDETILETLADAADTRSTFPTATQSAMHGRKQPSY